MADIYNIRRERLRQFLKTKDRSQAWLGKRVGYARGAYISQLLSSPPRRRMGEVVARKWEKLLGLEDGWFDGKDQTDAPQKISPLDEEVLEEIIEITFRAIKSLRLHHVSSKKIARIVTMQYQDAVRDGKPDLARINQLLQFPST